MKAAIEDLRDLMCCGSCGRGCECCAWLCEKCSDDIAEALGETPDNEPSTDEQNGTP